MFKFRVSSFALVLAAMTLASCVQDDLERGNSTPDNSLKNAANNLKTVRLAGFAANDERVTYNHGTRAAEAAEPGSLELLATIANPSKSDGFNFTADESGRVLSATCVYYNEDNDTFYVTYHMQGNNYNSTVESPTAGAIQTFKVSDDGTVTLGSGFRAPEPATEDFDFNHLYFDNTAQRVIASGHRVKNGNEKNTNAIIGIFDPAAGTYTYATVKTGEKEYDAAGKSLGYKDAGDVNAVTRSNDLSYSSAGGKYYGYPTYYVATRRGMALLSAEDETLFQTVHNEDGSSYFVATPGSAKFVIDNPRTGSAIDLLYLSEEHEGDVAYNTSSEARIATFQVTYGKTDGYILLNPMTEYGYHTYYNSTDLDLLDYPCQQVLPAVVTPIDGKNNVWTTWNGGEYYAALGTSGMYYRFHGTTTNRIHTGVMTFGENGAAPVNYVTADACEQESGHDGFIYIANGSKLTIIHRGTLDEITSYHEPVLDAEGNSNPSSANYISVRKAPANPDWSGRTRYVAVAFGQAGVKIFKFTPTTGKTVWEYFDEE